MLRILQEFLAHEIRKIIMDEKFPQSFSRFDQNPFYSKSLIHFDSVDQKNHNFLINNFLNGTTLKLVFM